MRRTFLIVGLLLLFSSFKNNAYAYSDVSKGFWAEESISQLSDRKIFSGYPDGTFRPQNNITIAEFLAILMKVIGENVDVSGNTGYWAERIVNIAKDRGILIAEEYEDFNPDDKITRREICSMLYRCFDGGENVTIEELYNRKKFSDVDINKITEYKSTALLSHFGVLTGYPDGTAGLDKESTRAEVSSFINKYLSKKLEILTLLNERKSVSYDNNGNYVIVKITELPAALEKGKGFIDVPYITTRIRDVKIFRFDNPPDEYKDVFDEINISDSVYMKYRKKFGENNYVLAISFSTTNNMYDEETYAGHEFLKVFFPKEDIAVVDAFDKAEMIRQADGNGNVGEFIKPCQTLDTSAFYTINKMPEKEILLHRSITGSYDYDSFHSLIIDLESR